MEKTWWETIKTPHQDAAGSELGQSPQKEQHKPTQGD